MDSFIDIPGASGVTYRFRAVQPDALPEVAGNFVFVRWEGAAVNVVCSGASNRLVGAGPLWRATLRDRDLDGVYIHLNTTRRSREDVHADVVAAAGAGVLGRLARLSDGRLVGHSGGVDQARQILKLAP